MPALFLSRPNEPMAGPRTLVAVPVRGQKCASRRDPKLQGELAEVAFLHKATSLGFRVAKPYGDSSRYDFIVDASGVLTRVQVKSVAVCSRDSYRITSASGHSSKVAYSSSDVDLLAAYIIPKDTWYLIPIGAFTPIKTIRLCPHRPSRRRFEIYREAWELFTIPRPATL